ncbi:Anaphase-promoting complex subunit 4 WD40 domain [Trinorchestia longiramus]|nr:Anaphase-promoting complex subunit 4 WD40 domain [Trinorchestia longiramus]
MTLYFDSRIQSPNSHAINTHMAWHNEASCLAVASYSEEKGGTVNVYTGEGKLCSEVDIPPHPTAQVTSLAWHPIQRLLAVGWETGELYLWNDHEEELHQIQSLHRAAITILEFSHAGSRLVTADQSGSVVGWRSSSSSGNLQTAFTHELKDSLSQVVFRASPQDRLTAAIDINNLARAAVSGDEKALDMFSSWRPRTGHKRTALTTAPPRENVAFYLGSSSGETRVGPVQKCAPSPWQVPLSCHFRNKVCSFSSFLCPASSKMIARKGVVCPPAADAVCPPAAGVVCLPATGVVYHVSESGAFVQVLQADGAILRLLHHQQKALLVVITDALVLAQFSTAADGAVHEVSKVITIYVCCFRHCLNCHHLTHHHLNHHHFHHYKSPPPKSPPPPPIPPPNSPPPKSPPLKSPSLNSPPPPPL